MTEQPPDDPFEDCELGPDAILGTRIFEGVLFTEETATPVNVLTGKTPDHSQASVDEAQAFAAGIDSETPHIALAASVESQIETASKPYTAAAFFHFKATGSLERHRAYHAAYESEEFTVDFEADYETGETILEEHTLPRSIVIIGGGYIALEWGQILHRVGVDVTILQRSERVLSSMERQLGREMQRAFEAEGIDIVTGNDFQRVRTPAADGGADAIQTGTTVETVVDGDERTVSAAALFVATGVQPKCENIGLETVGVETNDDGTIQVDQQFQTTNPDVYAAGDVIGEPALETVAAKESNHAVKNAFGTEGVIINYDAVPAVVFTSPEVASVGITELEYRDEHGRCSCRTVQMEDVPRVKAVKNTDGLVHVMKHHEADEIVGVHMVGPRAADMIMEATLAVRFGLAVDDIIDTVHPSPTFNEAFKHACQAFRRDTSTMSCCVE